MKAAGDEEGLKSLKKRKPQQQEDHYDDCGSDTAPLEEKEERVAMATVTGTMNDAWEYSFWEEEE